jgi:O-methyltransferase
MNWRQKALLYLLENKPELYFRLKGFSGHVVTKDTQFWKAHAQLIRDGRGIQSVQERLNLWMMLKATHRLEGALAEVGVYRGGSAKLMCLVKDEAPLYLFDTFEGMPTVNKSTDGVFNTGDFADTSLEDVRSYLAKFPNVSLYRGFFPDSALGKQPEALSYRFVHLDVDIYESTLKALQFFYPRMVKGGIIISHDYGKIVAPGVAQAFHEFFADKSETIVPLWYSQCVVTKN